jgi:hypothetical protein
MNGIQAENSFHAAASQSSKFFDELQRLCGDDADALFLEESWTLGASAAVENLHRRRRERAAREAQGRAFREMDSMTAANIGSAAGSVESFLADRAAAIASHYTGSPYTAAAQETAPAWSPQDWTPEDRMRQRWIPQGWMPGRAAQETAQLEEAKPGDMTLAWAHQLLGVTASSSREQIRSAYRRMVSDCHPDRMQHAPEPVRRRATQQLADLNEAYRLLCEALMEQAA